jgi:glycosyltransferase involved in cell wall biosynthesis
MEVELSIVIPAINEATNLARLIPQTWELLKRLEFTGEIIVVVGPSTDHTAETSRRHGAQVIQQRSKGYGGALTE